MDYAELLMKYIQYVQMCEGTNFLDHCEGHDSNIFTNEEWKELLFLEEQGYKKDFPAVR